MHPVLRKVAAGLAHDPHRNASNGLAPDGAQQPVILQLREGVLGIASWRFAGCCEHGLKAQTAMGAKSITARVFVLLPYA